MNHSLRLLCASFALFAVKKYRNRKVRKVPVFAIAIAGVSQRNRKENSE